MQDAGGTDVSSSVLTVENLTFLVISSTLLMLLLAVVAVVVVVVESVDDTRLRVGLTGEKISSSEPNVADTWLSSEAIAMSWLIRFMVITDGGMINMLSGSVVELCDERFYERMTTQDL